MMRLHFFRIPVHDRGEFAAELNQFLGTHRVASIKKDLVHDGPNSFWSVCVSVSEAREPDGFFKKPRLDYREILSPADFEIYSRLRTLRKELSEADGVPAYSLFKNEHLAAMVTERVNSLAKMQTIEGVGPTRLEKYGAPFLQILQGEFGMPNGAS